MVFTQPGESGGRGSRERVAAAQKVPASPTHQVIPLWKEPQSVWLKAALSREEAEGHVKQ